MPEYNSNIRALNDIVVDYGLPGGHHFEIDALNAWAVHLGGSGGHQFNIDALNEIIGLVGGSGSFQFEIDAYNEISRALGGGSDFRFVEDALSEISDLPVFGGEPEALFLIDFKNETYQAGGIGVDVATMCGGDFSSERILAGTGYRGPAASPTGKLNIIGDALAAAIDTAGVTIIIKGTLADGSPTTTSAAFGWDMTDEEFNTFVSLRVRKQVGQTDRGYLQENNGTTNFDIADYGTHYAAFRKHSTALEASIDGAANITRADPSYDPAPTIMEVEVRHACVIESIAIYDVDDILSVDLPEYATLPA